MSSWQVGGVNDTEYSAICVGYIGPVLLLQNIIANVCHEFNNNHVIFKTIQFIGFVRL